MRTKSAFRMALTPVVVALAVAACSAGSEHPMATSGSEEPSANQMIGAGGTSSGSATSGSQMIGAGRDSVAAEGVLSGSDGQMIGAGG
jgi:hypothetical protein